MLRGAASSLMPEQAGAKDLRTTYGTRCRSAVKVVKNTATSNGKDIKCVKQKCMRIGSAGWTE